MVASPTIEAFDIVWTQSIVHVRGESRKLSDKTIEELRQKSFPTCCVMAEAFNDGHTAGEEAWLRIRVQSHFGLNFPIG